MKLGLNTFGNKPPIPPLNANGTVPVGAGTLRFFGFRGCVVDGRPCDGARVINPASDMERCSLDCSIQKKYVSIDDSKVCRRQE